MMLMSCGGCGSHRAEVRDPSGLVKGMNYDTVGLVLPVEGDVGAKVYCTGVWVGEKEILTAHHCVQAVANIIAGISDGDEDAPVDDVKIHYIVQGEVEGVQEEPNGIHLGKVSADDSTHDLALVNVVGNVIPPHGVVDLADIGPGVGERVEVVGHVRGYYWTYIEGVVASYRDSVPGVDKMGPFMQVSAPIYFGNSGGGIFNNSGELVGIVSFLDGSAPLLNFAVSLKNIDNFLRVARHQKSVLE